MHPRARTASRRPPGRRLPALKKGSIFSSAPPESESTIPVRFTTTRMPSSSARCASASQSARQPGRGSRRPPGADSSSRSSPPVPVPAGAGLGDRTAGRSPSGSSPRAAHEVAGGEDARVADLALGVVRSSAARSARRGGARPRRGRAGRRAAACRCLRVCGQIVVPAALRESAVTSSPALLEGSHNRAADHAGRAGDRDAHQLDGRALDRRLLRGSAPRRRAPPPPRRRWPPRARRRG